MSEKPAGQVLRGIEVHGVRTVATRMTTMGHGTGQAEDAPGRRSVPSRRSHQGRPRRERAWRAQP